MGVGVFVSPPPSGRAKKKLQYVGVEFYSASWRGWLFSPEWNYTSTLRALYYRIFGAYFYQNSKEESCLQMPYSTYFQVFVVHVCTRNASIRVPDSKYRTPVRSPVVCS